MKIYHVVLEERVELTVRVVASSPSDAIEYLKRNPLPQPILEVRRGITINTDNVREAKEDDE